MDTLDLLEDDSFITRVISVLTYVSENTGETCQIGSQDVRASGSSLFSSFLFFSFHLVARNAIYTTLCKYIDYDTTILKFCFYIRKFSQS